MTNFWQAKDKHKVISKVVKENRLYYNDAGQVVAYSQEELDGDYIIVDQQTFNERRTDILVQNGKVVRLNFITQFRKLVPDNEGVETLAEDVTIVDKGQFWKLKYYD